MACTPVLPQLTTLDLTGTQGNGPPVELLVLDRLRVLPDSVPK
jgi:hypothetical protein